MEGFYYPATILSDVTPENTALKVEIFGPVAAVIKVWNVQLIHGYRQRMIVMRLKYAIDLDLDLEEESLRRMKNAEKE